MMKDFVQEFDKFKSMLQNNESFAFSRFSDGECFILQNKRVVLGENFYITGNKAGANTYGPEEQKEFDPEQHKMARQLLIDAWNHKQHNYFKGIPSKQDSIHIDFECDRTADDLTFANLFINFNYKRFIEEIVLKLFAERDIIYIVNERADLRGLPFVVKKDFRIGSDCLNNDQHIVSEILEWIEQNNVKNHIILCSAASLSNIIIHQGFSVNSNNTFLDIGSTLNPYLGDKMQSCFQTRDYLREYWWNQKTHYGNQKDLW